MDANKIIESINLCVDSKAKDCYKCRYKDAGSCAVSMMKDAVKAMESQQKRIAELEAERAALIEVVHSRCGCDSCKYKALDACVEPCDSCKRTGGKLDNWEWCGLEQEV